MVALYPPLGDGGNAQALIFFVTFFIKKKSKHTLAGNAALHLRTIYQNQ